jgi:DNA-binding transcriptional LysR family regulator
VELRQLRSFTVICDEGSLTRAAARLHLAQQSLSQLVAVLEAELGVTLLERGAFGVRPTAAGRLLRSRGTALLRDADDTVRAIREAGALCGGTVAVRYGLDSEHLAGPLMGALAAQLPGIAVTGWTAPDPDNLHALRGGATDLVFAWVVPPDAGELQTLTVTVELCLAAVPDAHPLADRPAIPVCALAGVPLVMFPRAAAPAVFDHIAGHLTVDARRPPRITETAVGGQAGVVDEAVRIGAIAPVSRSLTPSLRRPGVRFVPFEPEVNTPLQLVWRSGPSAAVAQVIAAIRSGRLTAPARPASVDSPTP